MDPQHEDLVAAGIAIISGVNMAYTGHGRPAGAVKSWEWTTPLGTSVSLPTPKPQRVVSQWRTALPTTPLKPFSARISAMSSGDVLLLEAQTTYSTASG